MGKITFSGSGTSGPIGAWDDLTPTANEEAHGTAVSGTADGPVNGASTANSFIYDKDLGDFVEGLAVKAAYTPSATTTKVNSSTEYGVSYTNGGFSANLAMGENNDQISTGTQGSGKIDNSVFYVGYSMDNGLKVGYQVNENDSATANEDEDFTAIGISYAVSDDVSISYNISEIDYEASTLGDQEAQGISASITNGGMTISGTYSTVDNTAGTTTADNTGYELNIAFAF